MFGRLQNQYMQLPGVLLDTHAKKIRELNPAVPQFHLGRRVRLREASEEAARTR